MNNQTFNIEELRIIRLALKKMIESKERTLARTYRVSLPSLKEQQKVEVANLRQEIAVYSRLCNKVERKLLAE